MKSSGSYEGEMLTHNDWAHLDASLDIPVYIL